MLKTKEGFFIKGYTPWNKGKKLSIETRKKMSIFQKNRVHSEEQNRNISLGRKGIKPTFIPDNRGRVCSKETRLKMSKAGKGRKYSQEVKDRLRKNRKIGKDNPMWKGGVYPDNRKIRESIKYNEWRQSVFIRDDFTCQKCAERGGYLEAHHKKPYFKLLKEAMEFLPLMSLYDAAMLYTPLWDIGNGQTLCKKCHKKINWRKI